MISRKVFTATFLITWPILLAIVFVGYSAVVGLIGTYISFPPEFARLSIVVAVLIGLATMIISWVIAWITAIAYEFFR